MSNIVMSEPIEFGLRHLKEAAVLSPSFRLELTYDTALASQAYQRTVADNFKIMLKAKDEAGFMYGILDLAQEIRGIVNNGKLTPQVEATPFILNRGIKFNIPLDARTPSYSDDSDSATQNISNMWDKAFWWDFLDQLALNKYNLLTLWNLSPFPSLVQIEKYPKIALQDVKRSMRPSKATTEGPGMYAPDMEASLVTLKEITIEEKIIFWQEIMAYAKNRCIHIMLYTWNLFVYGTEHNPYGITQDQDNPITEDYMYEAVKSLLHTYPLLAGLGITAGENMKKDDSDIGFLARTYGRAVREMKEENPNRSFVFAHRMQYTRYEAILEEYKEFPCDFTISFKYSQAHMYSNTKPVFIRDFLKEKEKDLKIWLEVRNDDFYMYSWANPNFAKEYLKEMPLDTILGFNMGPDGYTWGRDYLSRKDLQISSCAAKPPLVLAKQWFLFSIWGNLAYNIALDETYFIRELREKIGGTPPLSDLVYRAWTVASDIIPAVNCTHWHDYDFQWYPEGCCMYDQDFDKLVFADINEFMTCQSVPGGQYISVADFCTRYGEKEESQGITPLQQAAQIKELCQKAEFCLEQILMDLEEQLEPFLVLGQAFRLSILKAKEREVEESVHNPLAWILSDIQCLIYLGKYYAKKIEAAVYLGLIGKNYVGALPVKLLTEAVVHWSDYALLSKSLYTSQRLSRQGGNVIDVARFQVLTELDVLRAKEMSKGKGRRNG